MRDKTFFHFFQISLNARERVAVTGRCHGRRTRFEELRSSAACGCQSRTSFRRDRVSPGSATTAGTIAICSPGR